MLKLIHWLVCWNLRLKTELTYETNINIRLFWSSIDWKFKQQSLKKNFLFMIEFWKQIRLTKFILNIAEL